MRTFVSLKKNDRFRSRSNDYLTCMMYGYLVNDVLYFGGRGEVLYLQSSAPQDSTRKSSTCSLFQLRSRPTLGEHLETCTHTAEGGWMRHQEQHDPTRPHTNVWFLELFLFSNRRAGLFSLSRVAGLQEVLATVCEKCSGFCELCSYSTVLMAETDRTLLVPRVWGWLVV